MAIQDNQYVVGFIAGFVVACLLWVTILLPAIEQDNRHPQPPIQAPFQVSE